MSKLGWVVVVGLLLQEPPKPAPKIASGSWPLKGHPRLFGPLRDLAKAKPDGYKEIKASPGLLPDGIVHAVEGVDRSKPHVENALKNVARGLTNLHQDTWIWLTDVALTYDLFFDKIAPKDRQSMIDWMNGHLGKYTDDENAFHNSTLSKILCYLRIAYATWGENPKAKDFRDYALVKLYEGKVLPVLLEFGGGGGFTECGWYARGSLWNLVQALELARRCEKYDGFAKAPKFFYQRLAYEMFQGYPGLWTYGAEQYPCEGDGSYVYGGHNEYPRHLRTVLAQYFRGSELARAVATKRRKGSNPEARLVDFLYEEEPDPPLDLASFPLAHLSSGIGRVYARSDWTDDATWLRFECGDYWANHQHFEVGNFEIFRREPLATESGEYVDYNSNHDVNWLTRTIAHNCILVYQPDEEWKDMRDGGRNKYANDGGQAKKWNWVVDTLDEWKKRRDEFERGDIVAYENRPEFMFVAGDCTKAYAQSKLSLWIRQIVFLRPHTIVILDRVVSTKAEYEKTWLLHSKERPEMAGNGFTIGRLKGEFLFPENAKFERIEGYTYRGQTFDPSKSALSDVAPKWRMEVRPSKAGTEDLFLVVLSTSDLPRVMRVPGKIGVHVGDAEVIFDGRVGGTVTISGKRFALKEEVKAGKFE